MLSREFDGFTEEQTEKIARNLGFKGPMDKFQEFLASSPSAASEFGQLKSLAENAVKGSVKAPEDDLPQMAGGGSVNTNKEQDFTEAAINNPKSVITSTEVTPMDVDKKQFVRTGSGFVKKSVSADTVDAKASTVDDVEKTKTNTYKPGKVEDKVENRALKDVEAKQGTVSDNSLMKAAQGKVSNLSTVQGQLEKLYADFDEGEIPPWASGAMRMANAAMAQRGLGASSMAGAAVTNAAMEAALEIAVKDAQTYSTMDIANLNNRQQAALQNAEAFLTMDLKNVDLQQETMIYKSQARIQALFSDQSAENAAKQFNATSKNQTDQFFAELATQVKQFNAAQKTAISQFNAGQKNAAEIFNTEQENARKKFNAENRLIIDQSNAQWRRQISTADNVNQNEANRADAAAATGLTQAAFNNLWMKERDLMSQAFYTNENSQDRATQIYLQKNAAKTAEDRALGESAGRLIASVFDSVVSSIF